MAARNTITDKASDPDSDQGPGRAFRGETRPAPPGVATAYWGRVYNRADSYAADGESRDTQERQHRRESGVTYRRALEFLAKDLNGATEPSDSQTIRVKRQTLLFSRQHVRDEFYTFMAGSGIELNFA